MLSDRSASMLSDRSLIRAGEKLPRVSKIPGFFVATPKDVLLSEIEASLETSFADFQQQILETVRKSLSGASGEKMQAPQTADHVKVFEDQGYAFQDVSAGSPQLHAALAGHLPPLVSKRFGSAQVSPKSAERSSSQDYSPKLARTSQSDLPHQEGNGTSGDQQQEDPQDRKSISNCKESVKGYAESGQVSHELLLAQVLPGEATGEQPDVGFSVPRISGLEKAEKAFEAMNSGRSTAGGTRRPSCSKSLATSEVDCAALRAALDISDWQPPETAMTSSRYVKLVMSCACRFKTGVEKIEPKDLHFEELAIHRGKRWKELPLSEQVEIIREELTRTSCIIDPESDLMKIWDLLVIVCLVFTALVCPYEIAFLENTHGALYVINHLIDVIFLTDMVMHFFLKVRIETRQKTIWLRNRRKIGIAYLRGWFTVDLLSIIPYDDISNFASSGNDGSGLEHLKIMRLLRVLRLLKLFRMLKASRLVKRWENRNSLQSSAKHLIKCCMLILVSVHWMACIWGFFGVWEGSNLKCENDWQEDDDFVISAPGGSWYIDPHESRPPNKPSAWNGQSWVVPFAIDRAASTPVDPCNRFSLYVVSIYWAIMTMTSIGYGDILPQVLSEYVIACLCMVLSGVIWAYIIGVASSVLCNMYPESTEFERRMDAFNAMVQDMQVPTKIRLRGREFIRESRYQWSHERNLKVIQSLGFDLQAHLSKQSAQLYLSNIGLFYGCSELFCADCAAQMAPHFSEPHCVVQLTHHLCVVEKGAVGHAGRVLVPWNYWGEDFIVTKPQLRSQAHAIALNYALVMSLSQMQAERVLVNHPQERHHFARAAVCMAFRGAVRVYLNDVRLQEVNPEHKWIYALMPDTSCPSRHESPKSTLSSPKGNAEQNVEASAPEHQPAYRYLMSLPKFDPSCNDNPLEQTSSKQPQLNLGRVDVQKGGELHWNAPQHQAVSTMLSREPHAPCPVQPSFFSPASSSRGRSTSKEGAPRNR